MTIMPSVLAGDFKLSVQPMLHVENMENSVLFFESIGAQMVFGSRDGDWSLLKFGMTCLSLLAQPPSADNPEPLELQFTSGTKLEDIEEHVRSIDPSLVHRGTGDEAFGRMLQLRSPDGLVVKILELERDLIE